MMNFNFENLKCKYNNKCLARKAGTNYYCDYDGMAFDLMPAHCKYCDVYAKMFTDYLEEFKKCLNI